MSPLFQEVEEVYNSVYVCMYVCMKETTMLIAYLKLLQPTLTSRTARYVTMAATK